MVLDASPMENTEKKAELRENTPWPDAENYPMQTHRLDQQ